MLDNSAEGRLFLVGLGPGDRSLVTPAALAVLEQCDVIVGYQGYMEQISDLLQGIELVALDLGQELERASRAIDLAHAGRSVAVVSSGDAGIYGMAGPVFRVLTDRGWDGEKPRVEVVPGISALQSAAGLLGSPLMQDFCAISLSDLLTPWEAIRRRLAAAAQGDFVVAFYNPRSRRRDWQLLEARNILLGHRSGETPVGIVKDAYRPGQRVTVTDLDKLEAHCREVDMFTIVIVGNSTTYLHQGRMVTPRGYEEKVSIKSLQPPFTKGGQGQFLPEMESNGSLRRSFVSAIRKNRAKEKLQKGEVVTTVSGHMSSEIIDFLGPLGFDAVWLECEHGPVSWEQISDMTRAADLWGLSSVTRVNFNEPWLITRTLDRGSMGVVVPHVNTRDDAEQAMQSAKFAPLGHRGMFGGRQSYGVADYFQQANDQTMVVLLLEELTALQNLDEVLRVDYIDVFFVAPSDLAQTMGYLGNPGHPEVQQAIDRAIAKIVASGRVAGTLVNDDNVARYMDKGVQFLMTSWNGWLTGGASGFLSRVASGG